MLCERRLDDLLEAVLSEKYEEIVRKCYKGNIVQGKFKGGCAKRTERAGEVQVPGGGVQVPGMGDIKNKM